MATTFEPSLSTSAIRPPLSSATAPSMADSLPSITFGFDDLRSRMAAFTVRFDTFIEKGRKRVLEERNQFRINIVELQEDQRLKQKDAEIITHQSTSHASILAKEAVETREAETALTTITSQHTTRLSTRDRLRSEIASTNALISSRLAAQKSHAARLDAQAKLNQPELDFWQDYLCVRIEGAGREGRLKVVFTHLLERDWEREAWFELGTESRDYEVWHCRPKLEKGAVDGVLEQVNEDRDFGAFLKRMRGLFVEAVK